MAIGGKQLTKPNLEHGFTMNPITATAASGAATCNGEYCVITTESLSTAGAAEYTLTLTNDRIDANSFILASVGLGTASAGDPSIGQITPGSGSVVITVTNLNSSSFNGTLKIRVMINNAV